MGHAETITEVKEYNQQDCKVVIDSIKYMQNKIQEDCVKIKRLYTIHQIAIQYILNLFKNDNQLHNFWFNKEQGIVYRTVYQNMVKSAYRGARVDAFKTGTFEDVTYIDANSLYGRCAIEIPFAHFNTQQLMYTPLNCMYIHDLLEKPGISRCLVYNKNNNLGLLPVRTSDFIYFPKANTYIIGTWTHIELKKALSEGYKILGIEWSITWQESTYNPYKKIIPILYEKRKNSCFDSYFYKSIINSHLGKFAQCKEEMEFFIDDFSKMDEYIQRNIQAVQGIGTTYNIMYCRKKEKLHTKRYNCPYIPIMVNAYARCYMYDYLKKVPQENLLYIDTDSIIAVNMDLSKMNIGNDIGQFKIKYQNSSIKIFGRKMYRIENEMHVSGVHTKNIDIQTFDTGNISTLKMNTLKSSSIKEAGKFDTVHYDLNHSKKKYDDVIQKLGKLNYMQDNDVCDISYFIPILKQNL